MIEFKGERIMENLDEAILYLLEVFEMMNKREEEREKLIDQLNK